MVRKRWRDMSSPHVVQAHIQAMKGPGRLRGRYLDRILDLWLGDKRRWYERLPWVGDWMVRRRIKRTLGQAL